mmetsp:Transcript_10050/g.14628  ORF Transcript_10050/g.14628 Transcript_10050/m.14628 type:complete len:343 (+) Transcript_10050:889-1917(+)
MFLVLQRVILVFEGVENGFELLGFDLELLCQFLGFLGSRNFRLVQSSFGFGFGCLRLGLGSDHNSLDLLDFLVQLLLDRLGVLKFFLQLFDCFLGLCFCGCMGFVGSYLEMVSSFMGRVGSVVGSFMSVVGSSVHSMVNMVSSLLDMVLCLVFSSFDLSFSFVDNLFNVVVSVVNCVRNSMVSIVMSIVVVVGHVMEFHMVMLDMVVLDMVVQHMVDGFLDVYQMSLGVGSFLLGFLECFLLVLGGVRVSRRLFSSLDCLFGNFVGLLGFLQSLLCIFVDLLGCFMVSSRFRVRLVMRLGVMVSFRNLDQLRGETVGRSRDSSPGDKTKGSQKQKLHCFVPQ